MLHAEARLVRGKHATDRRPLFEQCRPWGGRCRTRLHPDLAGCFLCHAIFYGVTFGSSERRREYARTCLEVAELLGAEPERVEETRSKL